MVCHCDLACIDPDGTGPDGIPDGIGHGGTGRRDWEHHGRYVRRLVGLSLWLVIATLLVLILMVLVLMVLLMVLVMVALVEDLEAGNK